jgi:type IV pilus assembly protein PilY1
MWVFDVSSDETTDDWGSAYKDTDPTPLFFACRTTPDTSKAVINACPSTHRQPITSKPSLAWHPTEHFSTTAPNILVFFGTGQFLTSSDLDNTDDQNFYGIWDKGQGKLKPSDLHTHTITEATYTDPETSVTEVVRVIDDETEVQYSTKSGWNIPLPADKERVIANPTVFGDLIFFSTLIPGETGTPGNTNNPCDSVGGGEGWLMAVELSSGGEPDFATLDLNRDFIVNGDDALTDHQAIGTKARGPVTESRFIGNQRITPNESKTVRVYNANLPPRSSWTVQ